MTVYYNEIDPFAAQTLRNLISAGHIAPGIVDERSIEDVKPNDLRGFAQCHFFAGVGVWSYALRRAGWPDSRQVWTGSCPCQPFSAAGKGNGFTDERHLWPAFLHLISQCEPAAVLGEQVASKDADPWIDLVHTDVEALGYAFGAVPFPSAGVGAPHIRDRLYWVAHAPGARSQGGGFSGGARPGRERATLERGGPVGGMGNANGAGLLAGGRNDQTAGHGAATPAARNLGGVADANSSTRGQGGALDRGRHPGGDEITRPGSDDSGIAHVGRPGPTNGLWRDVDWLLCRDGKWRPVEPGAFPLAHGAPARVGRLRAYGNAINADAARVFIEAVMPCLDYPVNSDIFRS